MSDPKPVLEPDGFEIDATEEKVQQTVEATAYTRVVRVSGPSLVALVDAVHALRDELSGMGLTPLEASTDWAIVDGVLELTVTWKVMP